MLEPMRTAAKSTLSPILYRYPPFGQQPPRLAFCITALLERAHVDAHLAEISYSHGGTAILARQALAAAVWKCQYTCFDTFNEFISERHNKASRPVGTR